MRAAQSSKPFGSRPWSYGKAFLLRQEKRPRATCRQCVKKFRESCGGQEKLAQERLK